VVFVAIIAAAFLGEKLSPLNWLGVALIAAGAVLVAAVLSRAPTIWTINSTSVFPAKAGIQIHPDASPGPRPSPGRRMRDRRSNLHLSMDELSIADVLAEVAVLVKPYFGRGRTADYIPQLACVPPTKFGMAVRLVSGEEAVIGDADEGFSVQSITKVFSLGLALNRFGDEVWTRVGKEPSGTPFNHLSQLEAEDGVPRNPFINAGALAICDQLMDVFKDPPALVRGFAGFLAGERVEIDEAVAASELANAHQNRAIANLMRGKGTISHDPEAVVAAYCRQCALTMSCRQLARAMLPLAAGGFSPLVEETIFPERLSRRLNALLLTCGIYDSVGSFAYRVGLPAKSGVGGGIVAIVPGKAAIAVWSPELDRFGTSVVGTVALERFSQLTNCSVL
jgi:glutaminase